MIKELEDILYSKLKQNLNSMNSSIEEISKETDLLKVGILDSMEFVELISELSKQSGQSIESFLDEEDNLCISINWFAEKFKNLQ